MTHLFLNITILPAFDAYVGILKMGYPIWYTNYIGRDNTAVIRNRAPEIGILQKEKNTSRLGQIDSLIDLVLLENVRLTFSKIDRKPCRKRLFYAG